MTDYNLHTPQPTMADKVLAGSIRKRKEVIPEAIVYLTTSFNNTIICIRKGGDTLAISSSGACEFKGTKKGTAFAARVAFEKAIEKACDKYRSKYKHNLGRIEVRIKGPGQGSEQAIMALKNKDIEVTQIINITSIPHNGCRPRKRRRV
ncbi:MAG: 30S ribosomal protein S11 [Rickettsiella sp.]|nr:30S ribosomal protein S11 [Rickettsiella sp.]